MELSRLFWLKVVFKWETRISFLPVHWTHQPLVLLIQTKVITRQRCVPEFEKFVELSIQKVADDGRWTADRYCKECSRMFVGSKVYILYPPPQPVVQQQHLPIQSFPFTVLKILSQFFLLGKLLGQMQPNMGDCRRVCHEL